MAIYDRLGFPGCNRSTDCVHIDGIAAVQERVFYIKERKGSLPYLMK